METKEESNENGLGRRKVLRFGLGFMAGVGIISALGGIGKKTLVRNNKVKMLTPDGKLVEIDASLLDKNVVSEHISNEELKQWMTKKPHNI